MTAAVTLALGGLAACGGDDEGGAEAGGATGSSKSGTIALLLPESQTARYESHDRPLFEAKVKELCPDCKVLYANADQDAAKQQQQAESVLTEGAEVIVLDAVDGKAAASIANSAKGEGVPVVAYDRFVEGVDYYVSYQNEKVGQLQGQALVDKLKADGATGGILMVNGAPTDNNAGEFKKGAHSVIDPSGIKVLAEYDTPEWSASKAQEWVAGQLSQVQGQLAGVYAANDNTGGGAIAAMKAGGVNPIPPVTGQDAELTGIQRIVSGDQYMTVYKAVKPEADDAGTAAIALLNGDKPKSDTEYKGVPATLLEPVAVTKDNIKDTVVKDGYWKASDICTAEYAQACASVGLA